MASPKINIKNVCESYNKARMQNIGTKFSSKKAIETLKSFGLSKNMSEKMLRQTVLFTRVKREGRGRGNHVGYVFNYEPVHMSWFHNWLTPVKKESTTPVVTSKDEKFEEECVAYLRNLGYSGFKKPVGFDETKFKKDYPGLYEKYVIYETL